MASPIKPSDCDAAVVLPEDSIGKALYKTFVVLPVLFYRLVKWMFNSDGSLSLEFSTMICAVACADSTTT